MFTSSPNITIQPKVIISRPSFLMYLEKTGPFQRYAPLAWQEFIECSDGYLDEANIEIGVGLTHIDRTREGDAAFTYQAGVLLLSTPPEIPKGLAMRVLEGGNYASFILTGSHAHLSMAYQFAFAAVEKRGLTHRCGEFCVEKYLNKPTETPEAELRTQILIPIE